MRAALEGNVPALELMLNGGQDPNARDKNGRTALMFAVINMHSTSAKLLIDHGADINAVANDGSTPLMLAASSGDTESVREMLKRGASLAGRQSWTGETALTLADRRGYRDIVELLLTAAEKK
jgi:ankyrin repeat protein